MATAPFTFSSSSSAMDVDFPEGASSTRLFLSDSPWSQHGFSTLMELDPPASSSSRSSRESIETGGSSSNESVDTDMDVDANKDASINDLTTQFGTCTFTVGTAVEDAESKDTHDAEETTALFKAHQDGITKIRAQIGQRPMPSRAFLSTRAGARSSSPTPKWRRTGLKTSRAMQIRQESAGAKIMEDDVSTEAAIAIGRAGKKAQRNGLKRRKVHFEGGC